MRSARLTPQLRRSTGRKDSAAATSAGSRLSARRRAPNLGRMPDLADLYPDFESRWITTTAGKLFVRTGGKGPPLLLIHGYPQTNVMWHAIAPTLAQRFTLVLPDLPGYGWSEVPRASADHAPYDKRSIAQAMIGLMEAIGFVRFHV